MPFRPPFCPNPDCRCHQDPDTPEGKRLRRIPWFKPFGFYQTKLHGPVPRFRCLVCGHTCSRQTFRLDYYVKRKVDYNRLRVALTSCGSVRAIGRMLRISPDSVSNRISRLSRQYISATAELLPKITLNENLAADGFESFAVSQYYPNNIQLLGGCESQYILFADYATLRRKGRMTPSQKHLRAQLEKVYTTDPTAVETSFGKLLDVVAQLLVRRAKDSITLWTDKKTAYETALSKNQVLVAALATGDFSHERISSLAPRTHANPLFTVNYLDRQLRKDLAEHVRETVRFARNVCCSMERLWVAIGEHNFYKRYRTNDPVSLQRTHANEAGICEADRRRALHKITTRRRFLSFQSLSPALQACWKRGYETPLRQLQPGVMKALKIAAKAGAVDPEKLAKTLNLDSLTHDRPQYLPRYALQ